MVDPGLSAKTECRRWPEGCHCETFSILGICSHDISNLAKSFINVSMAFQDT